MTNCADLENEMTLLKVAEISARNDLIHFGKDINVRSRGEK